jgi:DNA-binding response OmpR family regulator
MGYMTKARILIVDSDPLIVQSLREQLLKYGHEVSALGELGDGGLLKQAGAPHLIVLHIPDTSRGLAMIGQIRQTADVPIILTAPSCDKIDRVVCLEAGADDCMCKPFDVREMAAKIQAVVRRTPLARDPYLADGAPREWRFKGLIIQSNRRRIVLENESVELTTAEFDLLKLLVANSPQPLSREKILDRLRGIEWEAVDRSVDILVSRLRDKLRDDPRKPRYIRTIRSVGYQFVGEADESQEETAEVAS